MSNLALRPGTRLRTGGTTYEVTEDATVPAGVVPVVPQASRLLKVFCETCGYTCRITQRWITKAGTPECPSGHGFMTVEEKKAKAEKSARVSTEASPEAVARVEAALSGTIPQSVLNELLATVEDESIVSDDEPEPSATSESTLAQLLAEL